ncbi:hypothetical protein DFH06DRAFT_16340 [Mycena polygramma]|nr:hypothetical protein DFH06DRAFT_16340 [Mycena polygramma]
MPPQIKRKAGPSGSSSSTSRKQAKKKRLDDFELEPSWPDYFHDLFKVFKALNTVLAFVSSRKQLATSFNTIKSSVESLLKRKGLGL